MIRVVASMPTSAISRRVSISSSSSSSISFSPRNRLAMPSPRLALVLDSPARMRAKKPFGSAAGCSAGSAGVCQPREQLGGGLARTLVMAAGGGRLIGGLLFGHCLSRCGGLGRRLARGVITLATHPAEQALATALAVVTALGILLWMFWLVFGTKH